MNKREYRPEIECPLMKELIYIHQCSMIVDVCEEIFIESTIPFSCILKDSNWKEKCRACKYHELEYV